MSVMIVHCYCYLRIIGKFVSVVDILKIKNHKSCLFRFGAKCVNDLSGPCNNILACLHPVVDCHNFRCSVSAQEQVFVILLYTNDLHAVLAKVDVVYIATRDGKELKMLGLCLGSLMLRVSLMIRDRLCSGWEYFKKLDLVLFQFHKVGFGFSLLDFMPLRSVCPLP